MILRQLVSAVLVMSLVGSSASGYAQGVVLPEAGAMVRLSEPFAPPTLRGMKVHPENPLLFDFVVDTGTGGTVSDIEALKKETGRLVNYFLAALTVPQEDMWVNLSPVEKDRIIPDPLSRTELGRDLLAQDYVLKQLTASLVYPEEGLGRAFWDRLYASMSGRLDPAEVPLDTLNKIWIMPDTASVYEKDGTVYVTEARMKVMLDADHQALDIPVQAPVSAPVALARDLLREVVVPAVEEEINTGRNFMLLRQVYYSLVLAQWYKKAFAEGALRKAYADTSKVAGVDVVAPGMKEAIYRQYMDAFRAGVFNYIKEDVDRLTNEPLPRKYFSGGFGSRAIRITEVSRQDVPGALDGRDFAEVSVRLAVPTGKNSSARVVPIRQVGSNAVDAFLISIARMLGQVPQKDRQKARVQVGQALAALAQAPDENARADVMSGRSGWVTSPETGISWDKLLELAQQHGLTRTENRGAGPVLVPSSQLVQALRLIILRGHKDSAELLSDGIRQVIAERLKNILKELLGPETSFAERQTVLAILHEQLPRFRSVDAFEARMEEREGLVGMFYTRLWTAINRGGLGWADLHSHDGREAIRGVVRKNREGFRVAYARADETIDETALELSDGMQVSSAVVSAAAAVLAEFGGPGDANQAVLRGLYRAVNPKEGETVEEAWSQAVGGEHAGLMKLWDALNRNGLVRDADASLRVAPLSDQARAVFQHRLALGPDGTVTVAPADPAQILGVLAQHYDWLQVVFDLSREAADKEEILPEPLGLQLLALGLIVGRVSSGVVTGVMPGTVRDYFQVRLALKGDRVIIRDTVPAEERAMQERWGKVLGKIAGTGRQIAEGQVLLQILYDVANAASFQEAETLWQEFLRAQGDGPAVILFLNVLGDAEIMDPVVAARRFPLSEEARQALVPLLVREEGAGVRPSREMMRGLVGQAGAMDAAEAGKDDVAAKRSWPVTTANDVLRSEVNLALWKVLDQYHDENVLRYLRERLGEGLDRQYWGKVDAYSLDRARKAYDMLTHNIDLINAYGERWFAQRVSVNMWKDLFRGVSWNEGERRFDPVRSDQAEAPGGIDMKALDVLRAGAPATAVADEASLEDLLRTAPGLAATIVRFDVLTSAEVMKRIGLIAP